MAKKQVKIPAEKSPRTSSTADLLTGSLQKNAISYNPSQEPKFPASGVAPYADAYIPGNDERTQTSVGPKGH